MRFLAFSNNNSFLDATWNAVELVIWTNAEPGIYLVAACLMTYRPLLDRFGSRIRAQTARGPSEPDGASSGAARSKPWGAGVHVPRSSAAATAPDGLAPSADRGMSLARLRPREDGFEHLLDPEDAPGRPHAGWPSTRARP